MSEDRRPLGMALVGLPDDALVPVRWVRALSHVEGAQQLADLTVSELASELDRSAATIRGWCGSGKIPGAYRLRGREWRIPPSAVRRFLEHEASERNESAGHDVAHPIDLGTWRKEAKWSHP